MPTPVTISQPTPGTWVANFRFSWDTLNAVKAAGFRGKKNSDGTWIWSTNDPKVVARLDPEVAAREAAEKAAAIEASRATNADVSIPAPDGLEYMPFQKAGISYALAHANVLVGDEMGLGKAQPLDAKVLTPTGWRLMGDIKVGDLVIGSNGEATHVVGVYPQGEKEIYRVTFSDGSITECCNDHLWQVNTFLRRWRGNAPFVLPLSQISKRLTDAAGNRRYHIPMVAPAAFAHQNLPLDPYLLGILLGDGTFAHHYIRFSTDDLDIVENVTQSLPEGVSMKHVSRCDYSIVSRHGGIANVVRRALERLGLTGHTSDDKFIPPQYMIGSIEQRKALLQGLLDTDGFVSKDNTVQFSSNSLALVRGVKELVQSFGGNARQTVKVSASGKDHHLLTISLPASIIPFRVARKVARYTPRVKYQPTRAFVSVESVGWKLAQCIKVDAPDQLYVTDEYILTHNTIQGIGVANSDDTIRNVLIICPASLKLNWQREWQKWDVKGLSVGYSNGGFPDTEVVIINYDVLTKFRSQIDARSWDLLVADECHYLKNPKAIRTIQVLGRKEKKDKITKKITQEAVVPIAARRKVFLTGTPIVNRPIELWGFCESLDPTDIGSDFWRYVTRYCGAKNNGHGWDFSGNSNEAELQERLRAAFMVRRLKSEVLKELPPKQRQIIILPANGFAALLKEEAAQSARHEALIDDLRTAAELAKAEGPDAYAAAVNRLREASQVAFTEMAKVRHDLAIAKIPALIEHLEAAIESSGKVVCMAWHHDMIDALMAHFGKSAVEVTGGISIAQRQANVDRFQTDPTCTLFVGSIKAAGVGLTLTASSHVVFGELWWVPGDITQAEDRCHRIGQLSSVLVQHLVVDGSLDSRMAKTIVAKQNIIDRALDTRSDSEAATDRANVEVVFGEAPPADDAKLQPATRGVTVTQVQKAAASVTDAQRQAVHDALRILAALDPDSASSVNAMGYNKFDTKIGKELAYLPTLSTGQTILGAKITRKYHRQLPADMIATIKEIQI